jgi:hypothetical protein
MHEAMARSVSEQSQLAVAEAMSTFEETRLAPKLRCAKNQIWSLFCHGYIYRFSDEKGSFTKTGSGPTNVWVVET